MIDTSYCIKPMALDVVTNNISWENICPKKNASSSKQKKLPKKENHSNIEVPQTLVTINPEKSSLGLKEEQESIIGVDSDTPPPLNEPVQRSISRDQS